MIDGQLRLEDVNAEYNAFVEKFKPKKTTDDCYTPKEIYDVILNWCVEKYGIKPENVVRPFYPGGDYQRFEYRADSVVVDNPPFSILSQIVKYYTREGIRFFLFAPYLTNFNYGHICTHICIDCDITYENGAKVNTSFLTNLEADDILAKSDPELQRRVMRANDELRKKTTKELPKYSYPDNVVTAAMVGYMSSHNTEYTLRKSDAVFIRALDSQKAKGKSVFGGGFLISQKAAAEKAAAEKAAAEKAAAEKAAAHKWELSERELAIIAALGEKDGV